MRVVDMSQGNQAQGFLTEAESFEATRIEAVENARAKKVLLAMLPDDAREMSHPDSPVRVYRTPGGKRFIKAKLK